MNQLNVLSVHRTLNSVGGGFVVNEKTKGRFTECLRIYYQKRYHKLFGFIVDENLFYKGVDKHKVNPARLHKHDKHHHHHHDAGKACLSHPPFAFHSGDSLLALTKQHNVSLMI